MCAVIMAPRSGALPHPPTALRIAAAAAVAGAASRALQTEGALLLLEYLLAGALYLGVLVAIRELHPAELRDAARRLRP